MSGEFTYRGGRLHGEAVDLESLAAEHGTPLYVYSRRCIEERVAAVREAFRPLDPLIAYSVKANGNLSVLRLLAEAGCGADIVSGGELHRALLAGVPPERIVFSGVGKTALELGAALDAGIRAINVESEGELRALAAVAAERGVEAPVSLRVNPDIESPTPHVYTRTGHATSKFGIPAPAALRLYREAAALEGIRPVGIDAHIGSQITEAAPYREAVLHLLDLVDDLRSEGIELELLDVGGGFGVSYDEDADPDPSVFAEAIVPHVAASRLQLVLEPGRYLVGHAGVLLTRVLYTKEMGGKRFVITDAGMNDLLRPSHYSSWHRVEAVKGEGEPGRARGHVDIVGPICESGDFLALDREMEVPEPGDVLAIHTVGAYGFSMASTYNARPRPAEVLVEGDRARVIRKRETNQDLVRGEEELLIE